MPVSDQGNLTGRYSLIPRTLILLTCGDRVLLLKGSPRKRIWANLYNGIGGHVERGEDVLSAALRELREETGLTLSVLEFCGVILIETTHDSGIALFLFRREVENEAATRIGEATPSEEGSLEWIKLEDLQELPLVEDLPILIPRVLALKNCDPPIIGRYWYDNFGKLQTKFS